jgi:hypothetical protein
MLPGKVRLDLWQVAGGKSFTCNLQTCNHLSASFSPISHKKNGLTLSGKPAWSQFWKEARGKRNRPDVCLVCSSCSASCWIRMCVSFSASYFVLWPVSRPCHLKNKKRPAGHWRGAYVQLLAASTNHQMTGWPLWFFLLFLVIAACKFVMAGSLAEGVGVCQGIRPFS